MERLGNEDAGFLMYVLSDWADRNAAREDVADMVERAERLAGVFAERAVFVGAVLADGQ